MLPLFRSSLAPFVLLALALAGCDSVDDAPRLDPALAITGFALTSPLNPEVDQGRVCAMPSRTSGRIAAVPNPYQGLSLYEAGEDDRRLRFINLPSQVRIAIVRAYWAEAGELLDPRGAVGDTVRVIEKSSPNLSLDWDLRDAAGDFVPSGFYRVFFTLTDADAAGLGFESTTVFDDVYVVQRVVPFSDLDPESGITIENLNPQWTDPTGCI